MQGEVQTAAAVTGVASAGAAVATDALSVAIFGVPMSVVLAAFSGAMIALTFISVQGMVRALGSIASGTVGGAYLAPLVANSAGAFVPGVAKLEDLDKPVAFILGLGFQIGVPVFFAWVQRKGGANA